MARSHLKILVFLLGSALLTSCTTTKDVMPGENGINRVELNAEEADSGREHAIAEAKKYCSQHDKEAVFLDDQTKYQGTMDENTRKTIRKASDAAIIIGGASQAGSWSHGDNSNDTGRVLGGAGTVGHVMTSDKDYHVEIKFKCQ